MASFFIHPRKKKMPKPTANVAANTATNQQESIIEQRHAQNYVMLKRYTEERHQLWLALADRSLNIDLKPFDRHNFYQDKGYDGYATHWEGESFGLTVYPLDCDEYKSWAFFDTAVPAFTSPSDRAIVFLNLDFSYTGGSEVAFTMDDAFYWINGAEVKAAGTIDRVLHADVIVTADGMIIPIIVKPFMHHFKAFEVAAAVDEDHQDAYLEYLALREVIDAMRRSQRLALADQIDQLPVFPTEIKYPLSLDLLIHIESDYDMWKGIKHNRG